MTAIKPCVLSFINPVFWVPETCDPFHEPSPDHLLKNWLNFFPASVLFMTLSPVTLKEIEGLRVLFLPPFSCFKLLIKQTKLTLALMDRPGLLSGKNRGMKRSKACSAPFES